MFYWTFYWTWQFFPLLMYIQVKMSETGWYRGMVIISFSWEDNLLRSKVQRVQSRFYQIIQDSPNSMSNSNMCVCCQIVILLIFSPSGRDGNANAKMINCKWIRRLSRRFCFRPPPYGRPFFTFSPNPSAGQNRKSNPASSTPIWICEFPTSAETADTQCTEKEGLGLGVGNM